jgi:dephospho-CoA kinase
MPLEEKQRRADWVISNAGDEARLRHDVEILMKSLVGGNE